ncbi:MAG: cold-shock protein [Thermoplasmatota archaeon]
MKGTVKFFSDRKNYGFIEPDEGGEDLFVHRSDLEGHSVNEGDRVEYETEESEKGPRAVNVKKIS